MRIFGNIACATAAIAILAACSGEPTPDSTAGPGGTNGSVSKPAAPWKAEPGHLDKATNALKAKQFACSDLAGDQSFTFRVCSPPSPKLAVQAVKMVAAGDGTIIEAAFNATGGMDDLIEAAGPAIVGEEDAAVLAAEGTTITFGTARLVEVKGKKTDSMVVTIKGLSEPPRPPKAMLDTTKEQVLLEVTKDPAWRCEIEEPGRSPEANAREREKIDANANLHCRVRSGTPQDMKTVSADLADVGDGIFDLNLSDADKTAAAAGANIVESLASLWPALKGADVADLRTVVEAQLKAGKPAVAYVGPWKVITDVASSISLGGNRSYSVSTRIQAEQPSLMDPDPDH